MARLRETYQNLRKEILEGSFKTPPKSSEVFKSFERGAAVPYSGSESPDVDSDGGFIPDEILKGL